MAKPSEPSFTYFKVQEIDTLHFTGGLRGRRTDGGWRIGPIGPDGALGDLATIAEADVPKAAAALGVIAFGADEELLCDPFLRTRIWRPFVQLPRQPGLPTETWASIAHNALKAGDQPYANLARNVSECLRAADVRLRDLSDGYGSQLQSALHSNHATGARFDNLPLKDLHLAIHSLVAEMGAARDYLAGIVGVHLNAPARYDSLARLVGWLEADARQAARATPMATALLEGANEDSANPWLSRLTAYRNLFLHRGPMGVADIREGPYLVEFSSPHSLVRTFRLPLPSQHENDSERDALEEFIGLHRELFHLAARLAAMARYPVTLPVITRDDLATS